MSKSGDLECECLAGQQHAWKGTSDGEQERTKERDRERERHAHTRAHARTECERESKSQDKGSNNDASTEIVWHGGVHEGQYTVAVSL